MYILEVATSGLEFRADAQYVTAKGAEAAVRRLRERGARVRVYQRQGELLALIAVSGHAGSAAGDAAGSSRF